MASSARNLVLVFEDDATRATDLTNRIRRLTGDTFRVEIFSPERTKSGASGAFEDRLFSELCTRGLNNAALYVSDRDLSRIEGYRGLSEAAVSRAADRFGIPIVLYAQGQSAKVLARNSSPGDGKIVLKQRDTARQAKEAARIAKGFVAVSRQLKAAARRKKQLPSPAALASWIMGRPQYADRVAQYALGDQKTFASVQTAAEEDEEATKQRIQVRLIGTWIYDSIIRFPGVILNGVAAASYLDIAVDEFLNNAQIRSLFKSALYKGPFADRADHLWWRPDLDDLLLARNAESGKDLAQSALKLNVRSCKCSVNAKLSAGYFCMITEKPISDEESQGGLSWFPPGADLARVSKKELEELRPWLALY